MTAFDLKGFSGLIKIAPMPGKRIKLGIRGIETTTAKKTKNQN